MFVSQTSSGWDALIKSIRFWCQLNWHLSLILWSHITIVLKNCRQTTLPLTRNVLDNDATCPSHDHSLLSHATRDTLKPQLHNVRPPLLSMRSCLHFISIAWRLPNPTFPSRQLANGHPTFHFQLFHHGLHCVEFWFSCFILGGLHISKYLGSLHFNEWSCQERNTPRLRRPQHKLITRQFSARCFRKIAHVVWWQLHHGLPSIDTVLIQLSSSLPSCDLEHATLHFQPLRHFFVPTHSTVYFLWRPSLTMQSPVQFSPYETSQALRCTTLSLCIKCPS